jgi:hypothetical protein
MVHPDLGTLGCRSERGRRSDWPDQTLVRANAAVRLKFGLRNQMRCFSLSSHVP